LSDSQLLNPPVGKSELDKDAFGENHDDQMIRFLQAQGAPPTEPGKFPATVHGIEYREKLEPEEDKFFRNNPHVAGMAASDNRIIINPYSKLNYLQKRALMTNEAARIYMRQGRITPPQFELSPDQQKSLGNYSKDINDIRQTIVGRILSGDLSAGEPTKEQIDYAQKLWQLMRVGK
jgi:hypothetical protein